MVSFLKACLVKAFARSLFEVLQEAPMRLHVVTGWVSTNGQSAQQQSAHEGMKDTSLLIERTHERETAIGLPALLHFLIIQGRKEHVEDRLIQKARDCAQDELFAFCLRELAQEQLQEVIANRFGF